MKRCRWSLVICHLLLAASCSVSAQEKGARERNFIRALELFDNSKTPDDYRQSAALLVSLLADGYQNGAVYYNLGNAYMRAGDYGRAIAAYRKAKLYRPRDPYLEANLKQAHSVAPGRLPEPPFPWWKHVLFWSGWLSYPGKFQAAFGVFCAGILLAILALLIRRKNVYWLSGATVLVAILFAIDSALAHADFAGARHAVVVTETVARKGAAEKYDPAFDQPLKDGAEFTIIDRNGEWVFGHFEGIGDGWLRREAVAE